MRKTPKGGCRQGKAFPKTVSEARGGLRTVSALQAVAGVRAETEVGDFNIESNSLVAFIEFVTTESSERAFRGRYSGEKNGLV